MRVRCNAGRNQTSIQPGPRRPGCRTVFPEVVQGPEPPWDLPASGNFLRAQKKSGHPCGCPEVQAYLRVPSIPSVAWQPYPSPLGRLRAHSFASPPHGGFAFIEDGLKHRHSALPRVVTLSVTPTTPEM